jgi:DMSO/TMAO reductase YedYZ molybdopterin-dependent catalytic subunit
MTAKRLDRRRFLVGATVGFGGLAAACDRIAESSTGSSVLNAAESLTYRAQRMLLGANRLAREFSDSDITPDFKSNGTGNPSDKDYQLLAGNNFADWRLRVDGLVDKALDLSLSDLRALPPRTQITRHDCVEGWSCIGKWTGTPLSEVLARAGVRAQAKFAVFHCADTMEGGDDDAPDDPAATQQATSDKGKAKVRTTLDNRRIRYYESIDLIDALHPQTILAYEMNGRPLPIPHGAPLRLRVERQLGYKMAKYLMRIELVDSFAGIGDGNGGYWEDRGYQWYAGI